MDDRKEELHAWFESALRTVVPQSVDDVPLIFERPRKALHGDYATSIALQLAKANRCPPRELANAIVAALPAKSWLDRIEIAGAGFINVFLSAAARQQVVLRILREGDAYGCTRDDNAGRVMVEFVSANPTGPLHVGHGRGAAVGDAIARLLACRGWRVHREYYYNDAGAQIVNLARSVQARIRQASDPEIAFPVDGYRGEYVREIAEAYLLEHPADANGDDLDALRTFAVAVLRHEQDDDLAAFGVRFDHYFLESSLYDNHAVEKTVAALEAAGQTYERDNALWLRTSAFGDDKDRVMRKSDGSYTYFVPDIAYHATKWERGFKRAVTELGADHGGSLARVKAGLQALNIGIPPSYPDYVLHQMILVVRGGEEVKLSKRAGTAVTLRELIDEVGRDAVRFFFLLRRADSQLTFDIDLARSQSEENPVYYVQYAHARVCSVLRQAGITPAALRDADVSPLTSAYEDALLRQLMDYPEEITAAARDLAPHQITFYLKDLAADFHSYYNAEHFLVTDPALRQARLALVAATGQVVRNGLSILGVSAPEQM